MPHSPPPGERPPVARGPLVVVAVAVVAGALLGWLGRQPPVTLGGDDSTYYLLAEAITGGRYVDVFLPGTPPHAQYPPGFPLLIAGIWAITGPSVVAVQVVNLVLLGVTALLVAIGVRRRFGPTLGVGAAVAVALNPLLVHYTGWILSETLFVASSTAVLVVLAGPCRTLRIGHWALATGLALVAFFTRSVGITTVFAVVAGLLVCRRRRLALAGAMSLVVLAGWFTYTRWATGRTLGWSYANDLAHIEPSQVVDLAFRAMASAKFYLVATPRRALGIPDIADMPFDNALWVMALGALLLLGLWQLWRRWRVAALFFVFCSGVLLVFPFTVVRLLAPLIPVVVVAIVLGAVEITAMLGSRRPIVAGITVAAALATLGFVGGTETAVERMRCRAAGEASCRTPDEVAWMAAAEWMRDGLPRGTVIASAKPSLIYRVSGHQSVQSRMLFYGDLDRKFVPEGPLTHVMVSGLWAYERRDLPPALRGICHRLRLLPGPTSEVLILEVLPTDAPPETSGCVALVAAFDPERAD